MARLQGSNQLFCFVSIFISSWFLSAVLCLPVPASLPSTESAQHSPAADNNNNNDAAAAAASVQPRQLGSGYGPRPIYGAGPVQSYPMPINSYGGGGSSSYLMNPFINAAPYGSMPQQYGGGAGYVQPQQAYGGGSYSTNYNYNFDPDWSHNAVSCAGGVYNWATNCDFRTLPATAVTILAGTISSALTIQTCAASCLALGVSSCNEFTYDPVAQVCFLSLQTVPTFRLGGVGTGVAVPTIPNTGALQCGFVGNQPPPAQPPPAQWNLLVPSPPCAADPFEFAMGCNFTAPSSSPSYYNSYNQQQQGGAYGTSYGGGYPSVGPINNMMMMGPYGGGSGYGQQSYPSYPTGGYRNNKLPTTIGIITTSTSLATCVAVCEVNGNCNNVFSNGVSCVLISGSGLATVQVSSGQCARILRPGLNNNNNNNYGNYQQQQQPPFNSYYRSH